MEGSSKQFRVLANALAVVNYITNSGIRSVQIAARSSEMNCLGRM